MKLTRESRIARVLGSQSRSSLLAQSLDEQSLGLLAECCDEKGVISDDAHEVVAGVIAKFYESQKATDATKAEDNPESE